MTYHPLGTLRSPQEGGLRFNLSESVWFWYSLITSPAGESHGSTAGVRYFALGDPKGGEVPRSREALKRSSDQRFMKLTCKVPVCYVLKPTFTPTRLDETVFRRHSINSLYFCSYCRLFRLFFCCCWISFVASWNMNEDSDSELLATAPFVALMKRKKTADFSMWADWLLKQVTRLTF